MLDSYIKESYTKIYNLRNVKYYMASMIAMIIQRGTKLTRRRTSSEVNQHPAKIPLAFSTAKDPDKHEYYSQAPMSP